MTVSLSSTPPYNPFALTQIKNKTLKRAIRAVSKIDVLEQLYNEWLAHSHDNDADKTSAFLDYTLGALNVDSHIIDADHLKDIPKNGSFIAVANHPLGGLEGVLLTQILRRIRPDLKVLTNEILSMIPEFKETFIGVDVLNSDRAKYNARGMRDVARHLSGGGALLVFPAGTVSRISVPSFKVSDAPWNTMIARLSRKYSAPIMPIFIAERNSIPFYLSAYIHKRLRTLLLPRAMLNKRGQTINAHIGPVIPAADIARLPDNNVAMHYIRLCCEVMGVTSTVQKSTNTHILMDDIKDDINPADVAAHIETLSDYQLYKHKDFALYCAPYNALGIVMQQLSIARERTFRAVDEGTGKELDSDRFDTHYDHLFLWDKKHKKIAGGYRLGKTDKIINLKGKL